jgi:Glyoxalase-like domain
MRQRSRRRPAGACGQALIATMPGIDHLVLVGHDLEEMIAAYRAFGFTVTPRGQHPMGTGNALVQLHGSYLELLAVTVPQDVPDHAPGRFSFAAFNRDYVLRHPGFSMTVLRTFDAPAESARWRAAGLETYEPFEFSRMARWPDGSERRIGFSLAFVSNPAAPWFGLFACHHHAPEYFAQAAYQRHDNGAHALRDVWITGEQALDLVDYLGKVTGSDRVSERRDSVAIRTGDQSIILARPAAFEAAFGIVPPHPEDGPALTGFTIASAGNEHRIIRAEDAFGVAIAFTPASEVVDH